MRNNRQKPAVDRSLKIPSLQTNVVLRHKYRFVAPTGTDQASSGAGGIVTSDKLMLAMGCVGTGGGSPANTEVASIFQSVRIVEIEMWAPYVQYTNTTPSSGPGRVSVQWVGTFGAFTEISDVTYSNAILAHVRARPPRMSSASFWSEATVGLQLFTIGASGGAVVDITVEGVLSDDTATVAGATINNTASPPYATVLAAGTMAYGSLVGMVPEQLYAVEIV